MVGQLVAGLANTEHQGNLVAEANNLITLEQKINWLASLETTDKSTPHLQYSLAP